MDAAQRRAVARLRDLLADPAAEPAAIADCYIAVIGAQLRQFAAQAHARDGRGAVEIDLRGIDLRSATGSTPIAYYPTADAADDWPAGVAELLAGYDPAREAVVVLYQDRSPPLLYVVE